MSNSTHTLSVLMQCKDSLSPALAKPTAAVEKLNTSLQATSVTAKGVGQSFDATADQLDKIDKRQAKLAIKLATLGAKMVAVHLATTELGEAMGNSKLGRGLEHAISGLGKFASIAMLIPGPVGLAIGAATMLASAFKVVSNAEKEAAEKVKELTEKIKEQREEMLKSVGTRRAELTLAKPEEQGIVESKRGLLNTEQELANQFAKQADLQLQLAKAQRELASARKGSIEAGQADLRIAILQNIELPQVKKRIEELTEAHKALEKQVKDAEALNKFWEDLKEIGARVENLDEAVRAGLVNPLGEAEEKAKLAEEALRKLIAVRAQLNPEAYEKFFQEWKTEHANAVSDVTRLKNEAKDLAEAEREAKKQAEELQKQLEKAAEMTVFGGLAAAIKDAENSLLNFRSIFGNVFSSIQSSLASTFEDILMNTKSWRDSMAGFAKSLKQIFIRAFADIASQAITKNLMGSIGGLLGVGGGGGSTNSSSMSSAFQRPGSNTSLAGGLNAGLLALGFGPGSDAQNAAASGEGGGGISVGSVVGGIAGGAAGVMGAMGAKNAGQGALAGAMGGMAIGAIAGPIGAVVGLAVGAIAGAIMGSRNKRRARKAKRRAEEAARAAELAKNTEAARILREGTTLKMGGGLATPEATAAISKLFSGGVNADDITAMGPGAADAILSGKAGVEALKAGQSTINVGPPVINVSVGSIASSYDAKQLAEDLGFHFAAAVQTAASG